jgi:hypothetical protein
LEQFAAEPDPYAAWMEALADWKAEQKLTAFKAEQAQTDAHAAADEVNQAFHARQDAFEAEHPDYGDVVRNSDLTVSPLMTALFSTSERGPEYMYYLGKHAKACLDLALATMTVAPTEATIAALDRRLAVELEAASTGTSAPRSVPRSTTTPIRPVRTGRSADTARPPGDDAPFSEHVAYWNAQERAERRHG